MKHHHLSRCLLAGVLATSVLAALAQVASAPASTPAYLNGGAGEEERAQMQAQSSAYPLQITFSARGGDYAVADTLTVNDKTGPVLTLRKAGPLVMLALPPGPYVVKATFNGIDQERLVSLGATPQKLQWRAPGSTP